MSLWSKLSPAPSFRTNLALLRGWLIAIPLNWIKPRTCGAWSARPCQLKPILSLSDANVFYSLQRHWKRCVDCDDMLDTHCKWFYNLLLQLEDDEGNNIMVSACNEGVSLLPHFVHPARFWAEVKCKLLSGLPATDLETDQDAFDRFVAHLQPVIGNIKQVRDVQHSNQVVSPKMRFTIESWIGKNDRWYGLLDHTPLWFFLGQMDLFFPPRLNMCNSP